MDNFVNLHNHSEFSLLDGYGHIDEYIDRAIELDQSALGLTDHGNLYGIHQFILACQKKGIKPVPGIEAYVAPQNPLGSKCHHPVYYGREDQRNIDVSGSGSYLHMTLFAMNSKGLQNLYKLVMLASEEGNEYNHLDMQDGSGNFYMKPRMDIDMLSMYNEGLIATTGCPSGEIQTRFRLDQDTEAYDYARHMTEIFNDRYYVEIMNHDMQNNIEKATISRLIKLSKDLDLPLLATNDSHYCRSTDSYHHSEMLCDNSKSVMSDKTYDNGGRRFAFDGNQYFLKSREEIRNSLSHVVDDEDVRKALDNTVNLTDRIESFEFKMHDDLRPVIDIPDGYTEETWFKKKVQEGYQKKRIDAGCSEEVLAESKKRIAHELPVFVDNNFVQYMLVVQDYIAWARDHGIGVGYGRGSVGGSEIAYVLDISDTDPIRHDLLFERFLNPERISPPDVDTDFAASRRDEVADYVKERYGQDHIANIVTFGRFMAKNAVKDMARIYGVPAGEANEATKLIPVVKNKVLSLKEVYNKESPNYQLGREFREMMKLPQWEKAIEGARAIEGRVKTTGVHACGIIMSSQPIIDYAPMTYKHNPNKPWGSSISQWTYQELESMGLIKMDFLALSDIDIIAGTLKNIRHTHGDDIPDMNALVHGDMDDRATYKMLGRGDTVGVFQLSSTGMQTLLKSMHPTSFDDIMASVALYRPGPMDMDAHIEYAARKSGKSKDVVINDDMDKEFRGTAVDDILKSTHGLCVYQEQVMNISRLLSGFSWKQADVLRKGMGHKIMATLNEMAPKFINGAVERSHVDRAYASRLYDFLKAFGEYGFNKSHSASYGIISYETAWLKCHYPSEFMAAIITDKFMNAKKPEDKVIAINEARSIGLKLAGVDVNNSGIGMSAVKKEKGTDPDIVFGFAGIKGLSSTTAQEIIDARENHGGRFDSIDDFMRTLPTNLISKSIIDGIGGAGGFDRFGTNSRHAITTVADEMADYYKKERKSMEAGKVSLFDDIDDDGTDGAGAAQFQIPDIEEWDWITKLEQEKKRLGVIVSGSPISNLGNGLTLLKMGFMSLPEAYGDDYGQLISLENAIDKPIRSSIISSSGRTVYSSVPVRVLASVDSMVVKTTKNGSRIIVGRLEDSETSLNYRVFPESTKTSKYRRVPKLSSLLSNDRESLLSGMTTLQQHHVYVMSGSITIDWQGNHVLDVVSLSELQLCVSGELPLWFRVPVDIVNKRERYRKFMRFLRERDGGDTPVYIHTLDPKTNQTSVIDTGYRVSYSDEFERSCEQGLGIMWFGRWI